MARVLFTRNLRSLFPGLEEIEVSGATVADVVAGLESHHPGLTAYILDERGAVRKHVNIFVDETLIADRIRLSDPVGDGVRIHIIQALSGG
ncbi:MAG TPA: MoaD/ThiS family protein [Candidatus Kapabacteria bacterium]|nr:MoaD/ThiS family protein [Candidatus Kapabacteria bacterium]